MSCNDCDMIYIIKTGRTNKGKLVGLIKERTEEHRIDVDKAKVTSHVYLHIQSTGHSFNFLDISVVGKSNNVRIRRKFEGFTNLCRPVAEVLAYQHVQVSPISC